MPQYVERAEAKPTAGPMDELGGRRGVRLEMHGYYFLMSPERARDLAQRLEAAADQAAGR